MQKKLIGTRISESVVLELKKYCKTNGILINHFVASAIREKLSKVKKKKSAIETKKSL